MLTMLLIPIAFVLGGIVSHAIQSRQRMALEREIAILRDRLSRTGKRQEAYAVLRDQKTAQLRQETQR